MLPRKTPLLSQASMSFSNEWENVCELRIKFLAGDVHFLLFSRCSSHPDGHRIWKGNHMRSVHHLLVLRDIPRGYRHHRQCTGFGGSTDEPTLPTRWLDLAQRGESSHVRRVFFRTCRGKKTNPISELTLKQAMLRFSLVESSPIDQANSNRLPRGESNCTALDERFQEIHTNTSNELALSVGEHIFRSKFKCWVTLVA